MRVAVCLQTGSFRSSLQKPIGGQWREKMLRGESHMYCIWWTWHHRVVPRSLCVAPHNMSAPPWQQLPSPEHSPCLATAQPVSFGSVRLCVCELSPGLAAARQGAKKYLELTPEDQVAEAEAAYAHLVDVLERSVVHVKVVLAGCLLGLPKFSGAVDGISCSHVYAELSCAHGQLLQKAWPVGGQLPVTT